MPNFPINIANRSNLILPELFNSFLITVIMAKEL